MQKKHRLAGFFEVVRVGELAGVDDLEAPALRGGQGAHPGGGFRRHRGRDGVNHGGAQAQAALRRRGQGHAVDPAAHRDHDLADAVQDGV